MGIRILFYMLTILLAVPGFSLGAHLTPLHFRGYFQVAVEGGSALLYQ